jgi:hypothetical protein
MKSTAEFKYSDEEDNDRDESSDIISKNIQISQEVIKHNYMVQNSQISFSQTIMKNMLHHHRHILHRIP